MALTASGATFLVALLLVCTPNLEAARNSSYRRNLAAAQLLKFHNNADGDANTGAGVLTAVPVGVFIVGSILLAVPVFPLVLVCVVQLLGFTPSGIAPASCAAWIMSLSEGNVVVGSVCAVCQSIGALGFVSLTSLRALIVAVCGAMRDCVVMGVVVLALSGVLALLIFVGVKYVAPSFFSDLISNLTLTNSLPHHDHLRMVSLG